MHRRIAIGLALVTALTSGALAAAAASPAGTTAAVPCNPTTSTIKGKQAIHYCGPATATIRIKGRTYRFKNGYCQSIHVSNITNDITLGTIVQGAAGNAGQPYFRLDINKPATASLLDTVYFGGKHIADGGLGPVSGNLTSKGTFKIGAATGTWNCHGVFVKH